MAAKRWSEMSDRQRRLVIASSAAEAAVRAVAIVDLKRRPASHVRGPKWAWGLALATISSFGILPVAYFVIGRRGRAVS
jgi:hypothetical protein